MQRQVVKGGQQEGGVDKEGSCEIGKLTDAWLMILCVTLRFCKGCSIFYPKLGNAQGNAYTHCHSFFSLLFSVFLYNRFMLPTLPCRVRSAKYSIKRKTTQFSVDPVLFSNLNIFQLNTTNRLCLFANLIKKNRAQMVFFECYTNVGTQIYLSQITTNHSRDILSKLFLVTF